MSFETGLLMRPIETPRLILVAPQAHHLEAYVAYCASARARFVGGPFDAAKAFDKLCSMAGHWTLRGFGRYVITLKESGQAIGHVGALQIDDAELPEMTWTLWPDDAEGRGYAFEAATAYLAQAKRAVGVDEMLIRIAAGNARSSKLAERLGASVDTTIKAAAWMGDGLTYRITLPQVSDPDGAD